LGTRLGKLSKILRRREWPEDFHQTLILYLYSLSTASPSSRDVIKMAGESSLSLGTFSKTFKKISSAVEKWNYNLHEAVRHASKKIRDKIIRGFFERLSDALTLDSNLRGFLRIEFNRMLTNLAEEFDRRLERAKKLIDAYSALLTSTTFLSIAMLLLSTIYGMRVENILILTAAGISAVLGFMVYLISYSLPPDPLLQESPRAPQALIALKRLAPILTPALLLTSTIMILGGEGFPDPLAISTLASGIPLLAFGRLGLRWIKAAEQIDKKLPALMKDLGDATEISGSLKSACKLILANDYGRLNPLLRKLRRRLDLGFDQHKALKAFGEESFSRLTSSMSRIMADALGHGSRPSIVGKAIYDYLLRRLENRRKRVQVAGMLWGIALPLQGSFAAISALITALMKTLYHFMKLIESWFPLITAIPVNLIQIFFYAICLGMAAASALAYYRLKGDSILTFIHALGTLLTITGIAHLLAYQASNKLIELTTQLTENITSMVGEL